MREKAYDNLVRSGAPCELPTSTLSQGYSIWPSSASLSVTDGFTRLATLSRGEAGSSRHSMALNGARWRSLAARHLPTTQHDTRYHSRYLPTATGTARALGGPPRHRRGLHPLNLDRRPVSPRDEHPAWDERRHSMYMLCTAHTAHTQPAGLLLTPDASRIQTRAAEVPESSIQY